MSETPISPLRARMIEDMSVRKFGDKTQNDYIRHVKSFSTFLGRSPAKATPEDLRRYQVHQSRAGEQPASINSSVAALRFFFRVTLNRPHMGHHLTRVPMPEKLRVVLSQEEVAQLLEAAPGVRYKAAFSVAYGAGLRVSELANLKVSDIDSKRMLLRIEQGKGKRDRYAMLSPRLLARLRQYWSVAKPRTWLFPGQDPLFPITTRQLHRVVCNTAEAVGLNKRVTPHVFRHYSESRIMPSDASMAVIDRRFHPNLLGIIPSVRSATH
jgi:integrase/recombinase XerD